MENGDSGIVCFGTIPSIKARCERPRALTSNFAVTLESCDKFRSKEGTQLCGVILPQYGQMIQGLLDDSTLLLYSSCSVDDDGPVRSNAKSYSQSTCTLEITVYGPTDLFDEIGEWFQEYNIYLQDPRSCDMDVKYWNPQRLSSIDFKLCPYVSQVVLLGSSPAKFQEIDEEPDLLDIISGQDDLEEAEPPALIRATLHKHQKQALTFMLLREKGWALESKGADIWEAFDSSHERLHFNRVTDIHQVEAPPQFYGGIIADPMGLGKTLTMIALIAADLEPGRTMITENDLWDDPENPKPSVSATLVIVPQQLMSPWEEQVQEHVEQGSIKFRRHHGKDKLNDIGDLDGITIVFTTYQTIAADWIKWKASKSHVMFSVRWKRIILDEAHVIRNMKTRMARAICQLESNSRWAVTGTPIQNHLSDLTALLKFIRAYPYDDPKRFDTDISRLWKSGEDEQAVKRLKRLARCLILRRAKKTIDLPSRRDVRCPVEFNKAERILYDNIRQQTITRIDDALFQDTGLSKPGAYVNFLQQIESMRLICNLGLHYKTRHEKVPTQDIKDWAAMAQEAFNIKREMEPIICSQCSSTLEFTETSVDDTLQQDSPQFSRCLKYACAECSSRLRVHEQKMVCGHTPACPIAPVSVSNSSFEEVFGEVSKLPQLNPQEMPSKIEVLISDLKGLPGDVKSIVFSTWRLTLDIIETGLKQAGIRCVRYDGKTPQAQRQPVLNEFKTDPSVRVILLTIQCGAVGLTLTEASRAYLMEPHWNPTIEEQALARIHRIGQTREVTTVRFYIRESFEERVMETQEFKKNLASVLFSGLDGGQADNSLGALQRLRSLL
ncbi:hypothetical protein BU24DRAFT_432428 [Aaosphaeria arxii CBS 175.79]|uniref:Uncharacterized protein n=1 Tax=Aaosphaeria arxii CBS 175.79 TaxID=1450172 RepID=A0A6A5XYR9_9PLEO|nr:uncharacterized protein BU24DRAFT_432428 [Aaosphaeria arxii CBS 175.79]KAF2017851.1 hypothetical protein BU24DRAFT_432428 [Aaosphaeria arxii CBS 175.79]